MTTVPIDLHRDLQTHEQYKHARLSGVWMATLVALVGLAITAVWIAAFFAGIPYLAHLGR